MQVIDIEGIIAEIFASLKVCSSNQPVGRINGKRVLDGHKYVWHCFKE